MTNRSPYGPDHSLLHAVLILFGGLGMIAVGFYLLTTIDKPLSGEDQSQLAEALTQVPPRGPAPRSVRVGQRMLAPAGGSVPVGGGVPAWAGSDRQFRLSEQSTSKIPQSSYDIDPDFGHAQLGSSSGPPGGEPGGGTAIADAGSPGESGFPGGESGTGGAPSAPDMSGRAFEGSATGKESSQWRSEARALASRSRALSNELGRLGRQGSREAFSSRPENAENGPSGEATPTSGPGAGSGSAPGMPEDPPQVPLGGTEWLAATGAVYALHRLRERDADESESEDDS